MLCPQKLTITQTLCKQNREKNYNHDNLEEGIQSGKSFSAREGAGIGQYFEIVFFAKFLLLGEHCILIYKYKKAQKENS